MSVKPSCRCEDVGQRRDRVVDVVVAEHRHADEDQHRPARARGRRRGGRGRRSIGSLGVAVMIQLLDVSGICGKPTLCEVPFILHRRLTMGYRPDAFESSKTKSLAFQLRRHFCVVEYSVAS